MKAMIQNKPGRNRMRTTDSAPTSSQIVQERKAIQAGWSNREKQRRRIDVKHPIADPRFQAHLKFIKFLMQLEADNG